MQLPPTLTMAQAAAALAALQAEPAQNGALVVDAGQLADFDSAALAVLLHAKRLAAQRAQRFVVRDAPAQLTQLAKLYGVAKLLALS